MFFCSDITNVMLTIHIGAYLMKFKSLTCLKLFDQYKQFRKMSKEAIVEINKLLNIQNHLGKSINSVFVNIKKYNESGEIVDTFNTIQCNR